MRSLSLGSTLLAMSLGFTPPLLAQAQEDLRPIGRPGAMAGPTVAVTGAAEAAAEPDLAILRLGATAQADTAAAAQRQVNQTLQKAIDRLKEIGVPEKQIQTTALSLHPVYSDRRPRPDEAEDSPPRITGYRASNILEVRVERSRQREQMDQTLGNIIDSAVEAGVNQLQSIEFALQDETEAKQDALRQATRRARAKAQTIADAMEMNLGPVVEVVETGASVGPPHPFEGRALAAEAFSTPIQPGQVRVSATLTLRYRLLPAGQGQLPARRSAPRRENDAESPR